MNPLKARGDKLHFEGVTLPVDSATTRSDVQSKLSYFLDHPTNKRGLRDLSEALVRWELAARMKPHEAALFDRQQEQVAELMGELTRKKK